MYLPYRGSYYFDIFHSHMYFPNTQKRWTRHIPDIDDSLNKRHRQATQQPQQATSTFRQPHGHLNSTYNRQPNTDKRTQTKPTTIFPQHTTTREHYAGNSHNRPPPLFDLRRIKRGKITATHKPNEPHRRHSLTPYKVSYSHLIPIYTLPHPSLTTFFCVDFSATRRISSYPQVAIATTIFTPKIRRSHRTSPWQQPRSDIVIHDDSNQMAPRSPPYWIFRTPHKFTQTFTLFVAELHKQNPFLLHINWTSATLYSTHIDIIMDDQSKHKRRTKKHKRTQPTIIIVGKHDIISLFTLFYVCIII